MYIALDIFCITFRVTPLSEAGDKAGTLSVDDMPPLFFILHLSFLADLLGLLLSSYRWIHRSAGLLSFALVTLHLLAAAHSDPPYSLRVRGNLCLLIVSLTVVCADPSLIRWHGISSLAFLLILSLRFIRKLSYEFFLRIHQGLTFLSGYMLWRHLSSRSPSIRSVSTSRLGSSASHRWCSSLPLYVGTICFGGASYEQLSVRVRRWAEELQAVAKPLVASVPQTCLGHQAGS